MTQQADDISGLGGESLIRRGFLHVHSGAGEMSVARLIDLHRQRGFSLLGITDHPHELSADEFALRASACRDACDSGFVCLYGLEGRTLSGPHLLGVGLREYIPFHCLSIGTAAARVHAQGGIAILAHPTLRELATFDELALLEGVEVWNGLKDGWGPNADLMEAIRRDRRWPSPLHFGGPDAHRPGQLFNVETIVATSGSSAEEVIEMLAQGHFLLRRGLLFLHGAWGTPTVPMRVRRRAYLTVFGVLRTIRHRAFLESYKLPDSLIKLVESLIS